MRESPLPANILAAAHTAYSYLSEIDPLAEVSAEAVIGFGTFDVMLASFCGELYRQRSARRIVFTGGIGAGTTDLGMPEADAWRNQLARTHLSIPSHHIIIENRSTNTAENIAFTAAILAERTPTCCFERGLNHALIVASPSRLRRVKLTLQRLVPNLRTTRCVPSYANFGHEFAHYESKGIDYVAHLAGELERLAVYPARGWIASEPLPAAIVEAQVLLRQHCS